MHLSRRVLIAIAVAAGAALLGIGILIGVVVSGGTDDETDTSTVADSAYLGATVRIAATGGLRIVSIEKGSPAEEAGLEAGDVIRSVDGTIVRTAQQLRDAIVGKDPGTTVTITYERGNQELQTQARLAAATATSSASASPSSPASATPGPTATPTPDLSIIDELLQQMPTQMRQRAQAELASGDLTLDDIRRLLDGVQNARSATIIDVSDTELHGRTFLGEEFTTEITSLTVIRRGHNEISAADLKPGEIVLVFSDDGGLSATAIQAFGVFGSNMP